MRGNNSKVQGNVFILKTIYKQVHYLHLSCYNKAIAWFSQVYMQKISKQGHITHII